MTDKTVSFDVLARARDVGFDKVGKSFDTLRTKAGQVGSAMGKVAKVAAFAAGGAALGGIVAVFKTGIDEQKDFLTGQAQLAAGIKSTGGAAHVTVNGLEDLASSIQNYSGQTDDSIVASEKLLLTFTNLRNGVGKGNDIFNQATKASADMAAKMGGDASKYAIQLGKALNDPVKGITALTRVGVSFTAGQKKQIEAMVKAGNTMGAQKVILGELNKEFGGSAKAAGQTVPGQMARAKRAFEDVSQSVLSSLMPVLTGGANLLTRYVLPAFNRLVTWVIANWPHIQAVIVNAWRSYIAPVLSALVNFFIQRIIPAISTAVQWVVAHWPQIQAALIAVWNAIRPVLQAFMNMIKTIWDQVLAPAVAWIKAHWPEISAVAKVVFGIIAVAAKVLLTAIKLAFDGISLTIRATVAVIRGMWTAVSATWSGVRNAATSTKNWVNARWNEVVSFFRGIPGRISSIASGMWNPIKNAATGAYNWVTGKIGGLVSFVRGLPGKIASAASGMWHGITDAFKSAVNAIIDGWNSIEFKIPGFHVGPVHFGGFTLGLPDIPRLATGAITTGPTLAVVGDNPGGREAIVPLPRNGGLGGLGGPIVLEIRSSGSALDNALVEILRRAVRVRGGNVQVVLGQ